MKAPSVQVTTPPWVIAVTWLCVIGLTVTLVMLARRRWRRRRQTKVPATEAARRRWVAGLSWRWTWDARNLGLVLVDDTTRHQREWLTGNVRPPVVHIPRIRFEAVSNGVVARMGTLPSAIEEAFAGDDASVIEVTDDADGVTDVSRHP
jgi:hypothetical protein